MNAPKLFISYCWSTPDQDEWVFRLATELCRSGVNVIYDRWDLKEGNDVVAFMEQIETNPDVKKVAIICDKKYSEKADSRKGGVGTETQIISPEIYKKIDQEKFFPIVREKNDKGEPYLPTYLKSRKYIDMSDDSNYDVNIDKVLRWIFDKPRIKKPKIGSPPSFLSESEETSLGMYQDYRRCRDGENCIVRVIKSNIELDEICRLRENGNKEYYLDALSQSECILEGHFKLISGKHSSRFIKFRKILENTQARDYFIHEMSVLVKNIQFTTIIGIAETAGGMLAIEIARILGKNVITFPSAYGKRRINISDIRAKELLKERCLYIDDMITTGNGIVSAVESLRKKDIMVIGAPVVLVRDESTAKLTQKRLGEQGVEFTYLGCVDLSTYTWDERECKLCRLIYSQDLN